MNKKELAVKLANKHNMKQSKTLNILNDIVDIIDEELSNGRDVRFSGLGHFFTKERASSKGRNPQTGEEIKLSARKVPRFKASERLKRNAKK